ncbi:hypothetical protein AB0H71_13940 [Nocardia sp. NPDC050697]|uniref:hypothetical protein n=1 Tax=Nocardia sp. NPDC050697 TaxID=3155158 RepID=UPI0033CB6668
MTDIQAYTTPDLAYRVVLLKTAADLVNREFREAKALMDEQMARGDSVAARTLDDLKLGRVSKSDPKPEAVIADRDELEEWLRTEYPDKLDTRVEFARLDEVLAVLVDAGRGDLITQVTTVPDYLVGQAQALALSGRPVPGLKVQAKKAVVAATSELAAEREVRQLLAGARVPLLRELEA